MTQKGLRSLAIAGVLLLTSSVARADSFAHAKVARQAGVTPICFDTTEAPASEVQTGCEIDGNSGFAPVIGTASAIADGVAILGTSATLSSSNSDGQSWEAIGFAEGTDTLRISAFGLAGTQGVADFIFSTHTADSRDDDGRTAGTLGVISEMVVRTHGQTRLIHSLSFPRILPPYAARTFFVYGEPFEVVVSLESKVSCSLCTGNWSGSSDASNTAELDVIEVDGLAPGEFLVESLLGNEYANVVPVPEPGAAATRVLGLLTLGMLWGWRRTGDIGGVEARRPAFARG